MADVTCRTDGCTNAGESIALALTWDDPDTGETHAVDAVVCGVCGQEITEIADDERTRNAQAQE